MGGPPRAAGRPGPTRPRWPRPEPRCRRQKWCRRCGPDGTGGPGTDDLVVTTDATVAQDDVVLIRGTVVTNKDFGAGYSYTVLIENAAVTAR